ncbi:hypothetical protein JYG30_10830 [Fibrella sp. USSR17]
MKRRRYQERQKKSLITRSVLLSLSQARPALAKLKGQGKEYEPLIDVICAIGEDNPIPSSKDLQARFAITTNKLRKWIETISEDFLSSILVEVSTLQFTKLEHTVCLYGLNKEFLSFACQLPATPRIGESISIPFVKAFIDGSSLFSVYDIDYELLDSTMKVTIWARYGDYNKHIEYLKDKAYFEKRLGKLAQLDMTEYEIEKELKNWY